MMKFTISLLMIILLINITYGQSLELNIGTGLGNSAMQDLKDMQANALYSIELPAQIIDNFPSTNYFTGGIKLCFNKSDIGLQYSFLSTGSRVSYGDYSGVFNLDIIISSQNFGPSFTYNLFNWPKISISGYIYTPIILSKITFQDYVRVYDEEDTDSFEAFSSSIGLATGIELKYRVSILNFSLKAGYQLDTKGFLHKEGDREAYFVNSKNQKVYSNWSGYRLEFLVGIRLFNN